MTLWEIIRFEMAYQLRHVSTWIYLFLAFAVPLFFTAIGEPTDSSVFLNAPSYLIFVTVLASVLWLLAAGAIAGQAAARDLQSRMYTLLYTAPIRKWQYLGGRFLAAFLLNALIQLAIPLTFFGGFYLRKVDPSLLAPFQLQGYLTTYCYLSLPLAFVGTAFQFSATVLQRRTVAAYGISFLLFPMASQLLGTSLANLSGNWELARLLDLVGLSIMADMETWTPFEKNTRLMALEGTFLWNRLLWISLALGFLAYTYMRFQFNHHSTLTGRFRLLWWRSGRPAKTQVLPAPGLAALQQPVVLRAPLVVPQSSRTFGLATQLRQVVAVAASSFRMMVKSKLGLSLVGFFVLQLVVFGQEYLMFRGVPQYASTMNILGLLTASLSSIKTPLILIPLLIFYFAGELVWREREAGLEKISDAAPVSEWVLLLGRLGGLGLMIGVWLGMLMVAGLLIQLIQGYARFEIGVYLQALFGFQLLNYLLLALLALVVHVLVNQKYLGHGAMLLVYVYLAFAPRFGIEHRLLLFGADPGMAYTDMRGFAPYVGPWLWFKAYWIGWALLLAVAARLLWVRSMLPGPRERLRLARQRLTRPTAWLAVGAAGLVLLTGGYILYNTHVLNHYTTAADQLALQARYEQQYGRYRQQAQPLLVGTQLHVELYPELQKAEIRATYRLLNTSSVPLDSIHLATAWGVTTSKIAFDRPFRPLLEDASLGHNIYRLEEPLQPGDTLRLSFEVQHHARGFTDKQLDLSVIENGSYFINYHWMPAIGYLVHRELRDAADRKKAGLAPRPLPSLQDPANLQRVSGQELIDFEAVVGTSKGQVAIGPGMLQRQWIEGERSYFQYATSAPIRNTYSFFSARYAVREGVWRNSTAQGGAEVAIRLYYHPEHAENIARMEASVLASLSYYSKMLGPYPYRHLSLIERSGYAGELNAEPTTIDYGESFTLSNLEEHPWAFDVVYYAIAHEVAHQWWGAAQLIPAHVPGRVILTETLANYTGLKVLEKTRGQEQVALLLRMWRDSYEVPRSRVTTPLLEATDPFLGYRKGPLALYALSRYIGEAPVNEALRQLIRTHGSGKPPLPTSLDLYRELKAVTPDTLGYLLEEYFAKNIYWQLKTEQALARQTPSGSWEVSLQVSAKKVTLDSTAAEVELPMQDWVEIGIYGSGRKGEKGSEPLYLQKHRIRSGQQTLTIEVPEKPSRAGIDPNFLLIDLNLEDNTKKVTPEGQPEEPPSLI